MAFKTCSKCGKSCGVRTLKCSCGTAFVPQKTTTTEEADRKDKKQCGICRQWVGKLIRKCECGHEFGAGTKFQTYNPRCLVIDTPAGKCPIKLRATTPHDVCVWMLDLQKHGETVRKQYSEECFKYFVRHFYPLDSSEHDIVCSTINEVIHGSAQDIKDLMSDNMEVEE